MYIGLNNLGLTGLRQSFSPASLYSSGQQGIWVEQNSGSYSNMFQDNLGTTPVTAVQQSIGDWVDRSGRGNSLLQATSTTRPILSARVNILTKTDQWSDVAWAKQYVTVTPATDSLGGSNAVLVTLTASTASLMQSSLSPLVGASYRARIQVKAGTLNSADIAYYDGAYRVTAVNIVSGPGTVALSAGECQLRGLDTVLWTTVDITFIPSAGGSFYLYVPATSSGVSSGTIYFAFPDIRLSSDANAGSGYQRVNTASDYDTAGFPFKLTFDGVDDNLATATFAAGTLTSDMDFFMLVKPTSAKGILAYESPTGNWIGAWQSAGAGAACNLGAGSLAALTCFVNGVQVGTVGSITQGQLFSAITLGAWSVIEFRDIDLNTFTALGISGYSGFPAAEDLGAIVACPAQSNSVRQQIRTYLGGKVGLSL